MQIIILCILFLRTVSLEYICTFYSILLFLSIYIFLLNFLVVFVARQCGSFASRYRICTRFTHILLHAF